MLVPVFSAIRTLQAAVQKLFKYKLNMTQSMPHIRFEIGLKGEAVMEMMVDSCAGLGLGNLKYHLSIYERFPHLVAQFAYIKDVENMESFGVGGVDIEGEGVSVEALISYHTPVRLNGAPVVVSLALSNRTAANTILGLPFLKGTRSAFFLDDQGQDVLVVSKLGKTYKVEYHPPMVGETAPQQAEGSQASFECAPFAQALEDVRAAICLHASARTSQPLLEDGSMGDDEGPPVFVRAEMYDGFASLQPLHE